MSRSTFFRATLAIGLVAAACGEGPAAPSTDLVGLWILPYQEQPAIYGLVSAQMIFRADGTFLFTGNNPMSMGPMQEFTVTGTWTRAEDTVTLRTGEDARTWLIEFDEGGVLFIDPSAGETFHLFRPLPD